MMIHRWAIAPVVIAVAVGVGAADEFFAQITKVEGNKVTYQKYEKGKKVGDPVTTDIASGTTIAEAKRDTASKKLVAGDAIEDGLKNKLFPTASGGKAVTAVITTAEGSNAVKQILVVRRLKK
jgi:hypothetical protein